MPFPTLPATFGLLSLAWWRARSKEKAKMTPKTEYLLQRALDAMLSPEQYDKLADAYAEQGFKAEAELLHKRANLARMSPEKKAELRAVAKKVFESKKVEAIRAVADEYEKMGAVGNAADMRAHANAVEAAEKVKAQAVSETAPTPVEEHIKTAETSKVVDGVPLKVEEEIDLKAPKKTEEILDAVVE